MSQKKTEYQQRNENNIKEVIGEAPYLIGGTLAWYTCGASLDQTVMFTLTWVYNSKIEGCFTVNGSRYRFKLVNFPEVQTKEFWMVDQLNHVLYMSMSIGEVVSKLERHIGNGTLDKERLLLECEKYGTYSTKLLLNRLVSGASMVSNDFYDEYCRSLPPVHSSSNETNTGQFVTSPQ